MKPLFVGLFEVPPHHPPDDGGINPLERPHGLGEASHHDDGLVLI